MYAVPFTQNVLIPKKVISQQEPFLNYKYKFYTCLLEVTYFYHFINWIGLNWLKHMLEILIFCLIQYEP